jgi:hypothetical protein
MPFSLDISHRNRYPLSNELKPKSILDCGIFTIKKLSRDGRHPIMPIMIAPMDLA